MTQAAAQALQDEHTVVQEDFDAPEEGDFNMDDFLKQGGINLLEEGSPKKVGGNSDED
jgi:hypothetical protein